MTELREKFIWYHSLLLFIFANMDCLFSQLAVAIIQMNAIKWQKTGGSLE